MSGEDYRGRRVLVVGLARSGLAAAEFLQGHGARVRATDVRQGAELGEAAERLRRMGVDLTLGGHPPGLTRDVDLVVASPGVPPSAAPLAEARVASIPVWGELELGFRETAGFLVAVTGTKGKSTTATLIANVSKAAGRSVLLGGNIGEPLIGLAGRSTEETVVVVEVSSFQLETTERFHPRIAVLLDVSPDHLDRHPSFEAYLSAKEKIFANQEAEDWAVVYGGNPLTVDMASRSRSKKVFFNLDCMGADTPHLCLEGPWIVKREDGTTTPLVPRDEILLRGAHNVENVMAAVAACDLLGIEPELIREAVGEFRGVPHALERIAEIEGVAFYNDSKATNVASARAALESFEHGVLLIMGGRSKGGEFRDLRRAVESRVKHIFAIGESRRQIVRSLGDVTPVVACRSLEEAVEKAFGAAVPGDTVLMSPACASFDMFSDYAERGRRFREIVERLRLGADSRANPRESGQPRASETGESEGTNEE